LKEQYEPPRLEVLGDVAELTEQDQLGNAGGSVK